MTKLGSWVAPVVGLFVVLAASAIGFVLSRDLARALSGTRWEPWQVPDFALVDQHGRTTRRASLTGHVWIADFIFTRCTSVCPLLSARMRELQRELLDPTLRFVSFSVDPEADSVAVLHDYANAWAPEERRWILLHSEPESLRKLVDGMRLLAETRAQNAGPGLHTRLFFLVDREGLVRGMFDSGDPEALRRLAEQTRGLADR